MFLQSYFGLLLRFSTYLSQIKQALYLSYQNQMLSPRVIIYISLVLAGLLVLMTVFFLVAPELFSVLDHKYQLQKKRKAWPESLAIFLNDAISTETVGIWYSLLTFLLVVLGEWQVLGIALASILTSSLIFFSLKRITQRPRPTDAKIQLFDYSFPSGHTTAGFVMMLSLALVISQFVSEFWWVVLYLLAWGVGLLVGRSRRYLKVHWITDIIAGMVLGIWCFLSAYLFFFYFGDAIIGAIEFVFTRL